MKPTIILLTPKNHNKEHETLELYKDGRIVCSCLANLYNKEREYSSSCRHQKELLKAIPNIEDYEVIHS